MKLPELPPLPEPDFENHDNGDVFGCEKTYFLTPEQIKAYATTYAEAAVKAERERLEPDARRWQMHMRMLHKNHGARQVRELFDAVERAIAEENT